MASLPDGYHIEYPTSRPDDGLIYNEAEVQAAFDDNEGGQTRLRCGYCDARARARSVGTAITWFHQHPCAIDELQAQRNRDLAYARIAEAA